MGSGRSGYVFFFYANNQKTGDTTASLHRTMPLHPHLTSPTNQQEHSGTKRNERVSVRHDDAARRDQGAAQEFPALLLLLLQGAAAPEKTPHTRLITLLNVGFLVSVQPRVVKCVASASASATSVYREEWGVGVRGVEKGWKGLG